MGETEGGETEKGVRQREGGRKRAKVEKRDR